MKKITTILASLAVLTAFNSCEDDKVTLSMPAEGSYEMQTPSFASSLAMTEATGDQLLQFVTNQPNYGYSASLVYSLDVALDASFSTYETLSGKDTSSPIIEVSQEDFSYALCNLHGFGPDYYEEQAPESVYVRAQVSVSNTENTTLTTETVTLSNVTFYHVIMGKRTIYLIGNCSGWNEPSESNADALANWTLTETAIGSNVYYNSFDLEAGTLQFRFYTALTGWDGGDSLGSQEEDAGLAIDDEFDGLTYTGSYVYPGKGTWLIENFAGGLIKMTVDMNEGTVTFELGKAGEVDYSKYACMYIIGDCSGWAEPSESNAEALANWKIYDIGENGIYYTPKSVYMSKAQFRFYTALTGWDGGDSLGYQEADNATSFDLTNGEFTSAYVYPGKGSWEFPNDGGNWWYLEVDTNTGTVTFRITEAPEGEETPDEPEPEPVDNSIIYVRGDMNGWGTEDDWAFTQVSDTEWAIYGVEIEAGENFKFASSDWATYNLASNGTVPEVGVEYELVSGANDNICLDYDFSGNIILTLQGDTYYALFKEAAAGDPAGIYLRGSMVDNWGADPAWEFVTTDEDNVWVLNNVTLDEGTEFKVADADWGTINYGLEETLVLGQTMTMSYQGSNIVMPSTATVNITFATDGENYTILVEEVQ